MTATTTRQARTAQHRLNAFLHGELLHSLGSYQLAEEKLEELHKGFGDRIGERVLRTSVERSWLHNRALRRELHKPQLAGKPEERFRHPSPFGDPEPRPNTALLRSIRTYYQTAAEALHLHLQAITAGRGGEERASEGEGEQLGRRLAYIHDPQRQGRSKDLRGLVEDRLRRTSHRLEKVDEVMTLEGEAPPPSTQAAQRFELIIDDHMGKEEPGPANGELPLHLTIVKALSDAHDWMHQCEHLHSRPFGEMFPRIRKAHAETEPMLKRSIALNTFVYVAARSAPWIFGENEEERAQVFDSYSDCHQSLTPTYCMWIGNQLGLIALERRAYTWWTMGRHDRAYRDFYKLTRLLKGLRAQVDERAARVPGTKTLVVGLTATAEHHIGRIYRGQHAHRAAVRYFDRASSHLEGWEDQEEIGDILKNSRWRLNLLLSRGKANYELGRMKRSLLSYAEAWRAFLQLAESESRVTANFEVVEEVIDWLKSIDDEPALSKLELRKRLEPLVKQFESLYSPAHLRLLAADIMMRLGHLLYVLKLPPLDWEPHDDLDLHRPIPDYELARRCMFQAAALDRTSTQIATDLLKIRHGERLARYAKAVRGSQNTGNEIYEEDDYPPVVEMEEQWPAGGGRFEEAARAIEYIVETWLESKENEVEDGEGELPDQVEIARELLRSFLAHTDSSNVKLAQVYRYLMQGPREADRLIESKPTIEIICLRRYSSFFPFLPRPAAFRALGGGYLVQVREAGEKGKPFGIAIDPGPDFLNNLYRCGYSLADIHMIVATHDHADHIVSLDALLALIGYRELLGDNVFSNEKRLLIVGNDSVVERYRFYNQDQPVKLEKGSGEKRVPAKRLDSVRVMSFSKFDAIMRRTDPRKRRRALKKAGIALTPQDLRIEPIESVDHFDAAGHVSQGFLLSMGRADTDRSSVLFTGDTGPPPRTQDSKQTGKGLRHYFAKGTKDLYTAASEADIVVAHISSVPFPELRKLAELAADNADDAPTQKFEEMWKKTARTAWAWRRDEGAAEARFLLRQLQFAFRSRSWDDSFSVSPLTRAVKPPSEKHLYLSGLLGLARSMAESHREGGPKPLLLIGELREELGTFRTRIASRIADIVFAGEDGGTALTADIGLRLRVSRSGGAREASVAVLCTTCDLDNDLVTAERFHTPEQIQEVCVKGENESVFYNCDLHDPGGQPELLWVESVERYNVFGD